MDSQTSGTALVVHPSPQLYGADRMLLESVHALVEQGLRVVVAIPENGPLIPELAALGAEVRLCSTPVLRKSYLNPLGLCRLALDTVVDGVKGLRLISQVKPDVVYVNTVTIPLWSVLARLSGRPVLAHVHEAEDSASKLLRLALISPLRLASTILSNSQYSTGVVVRTMPRLGAKIQQLANGVPGPKDRVLPRTNIEGPVRLLYVGRLSSRKGVDVAVDAVSELRKRNVAVRLDIVGAVYPGYEWYEEELRAALENEGITELVDFHGFNTDIWPFLAAADVALVLSRVDEPFGNTAVEAVLAARPLIVSDTSGLREAAAGYPSASFVPTNNPIAVADAVESIIEHWPQLRETVQNDAINAERRHSPAVYRAQLASAATSLIRPKRTVRKK